LSARHSLVDFSELTIAALRVEHNNRVITWPLIIGQVNRVTTVLLSFDSVEYIEASFLRCAAADTKLLPHPAKCFPGDPDFRGVLRVTLDRPSSTMLKNSDKEENHAS
jgi:hypothetical protein